MEIPDEISLWLYNLFKNHFHLLAASNWSTPVHDLVSVSNFLFSSRFIRAPMERNPIENQLESHNSRSIQNWQAKAGKILPAQLIPCWGIGTALFMCCLKCVVRLWRSPSHDMFLESSGEWTTTDRFRGGGVAVAEKKVDEFFPRIWCKMQ